MQNNIFTLWINWILLQVYIVAGGSDGSSFLSSTEMMIADGEEWIWGKPLPGPGRGGARGVSLANRFLLTGIKWFKLKNYIQT